MDRQPQIFLKKRFKVVQESINGIRDIILSNSHNLFLNSYKALESKFRLSIHRLNLLKIPQN